jgi:HAE1 family hydrophobic/amphiphilic exporter-1
MALGLGEGSELRRPMALTVIGGLLTSTALTLLIVPALYRVFESRRTDG